MRARVTTTRRRTTAVVDLFLVHLFQGADAACFLDAV